VLVAVGLLMNVSHQPLPVIKAMPLQELFVYANIAAVMSGRKFE
jgi:hypothetical protein